MKRRGFLGAMGAAAAVLPFGGKAAAEMASFNVPNALPGGFPAGSLTGSAWPGTLVVEAEADQPSRAHHVSGERGEWGANR